MKAALDDALMSTVNVGEVVSHYAKLGAARDDIETMLRPLPMRLLPLDAGLAYEASMLRPITLSAGLSLEDRCCLARASREGVPAPTAAGWTSPTLLVSPSSSSAEFSFVLRDEREGVEHYPLYRWTEATIDDPVEKAKYLKSFTLYVAGEQVYGKGEADALEAELLPLKESGLVTRLAKHDTNPANNPQPPAHLRG